MRLLLPERATRANAQAFKPLRFPLEVDLHGPRCRSTSLHVRIFIAGCGNTAEPPAIPLTTGLLRGDAERLQGGRRLRSRRGCSAANAGIPARPAADHRSYLPQLVGVQPHTDGYERSVPVPPCAYRVSRGRRIT